MSKGLNDSVRAYTDRNVGEKTKQKNAQLCFAQKTLRSTKTMRMAPSKTKRRCTMVGYKYSKLKFLKLLFIVLQHIISCVLAIKPDGFLLSEAFFEERSSTFC